MAVDQESVPRFEIQERVRRATIVHHVDEAGGVYVTQGRRVVRLQGKSREVLGTFPAIYPRDVFNFSRLSQRAARSDKCNVYVNQRGNVLGIRAEQVYAIADGAMIKLGTIQGDCVLHDSFAEDQEGWTYFGEYFRNPARGVVRIWRVNAELTCCEVAHEFKPGEIRHVHGVFRDPHAAKALWVSVGDLKDECYLIRTDDRFQTLTWYGEGTQKWRAVKLFFTPTHVAWITDSNLEQNYACRMDRQTGTLELGQKVDCSGWYGFQTAAGEFVAGTTVEMGPGILANESSLLVSRDGFHWTVAGTFRKDIYRPMRVFKYGVINFPSGVMTLDDFYMSGEGLCGLDGRVVRAKIRKPVDYARDGGMDAQQSVRLDRNDEQSGGRSRAAA